MIIDVHVHPHVSRRLEDFAELIAIAEQFDVQLVTYSVRPVAAGNNHEYPSPETIRDCNDQTLKLMQRHPDRVHGFAYVNPGHAHEACTELDYRLREQRFVGLKLWVAVPCIDPRLDALMEICAHFRVPALQHTWQKANGQKAGESPPGMVAALAKRHPRTTLIAAHAGGDYEYGAKVFRSCENVLLDIGGNECNAGYVEILVNHVGADRVIFGTDMPGRSFSSQLAKVLGTDLSAEDKHKILYGNMASVLAQTKTIGDPSVFAAQN
ncbi:MAG: amidohydrolase family protein [Chloroflexota bacterium]|nr:amidohydrolase family protein [Chloroflexota bacterium]MDE2839673.1 amidohydrolase family protein [Chloroflexota bacterium]MDE2929300.1 amidohydrolase family protein [Chloroflexota bacterium]